MNPKPLEFSIDHAQEHDDLPEFLVQRVLTGSNLPDVLIDVEPQHPGYKRTEVALQTYLALASQAALCQSSPRPSESISGNSIMPNSNCTASKYDGNSLSGNSLQQRTYALTR